VGSNYTDGFQIFRPRMTMPIEAEYGLYLLAENKKAIEQAEALGHYVAPHNPSMEEFKAMRKARNRAGLFWNVKQK